MNENILARIKKIDAYTPGERPDSPDAIKLNTNENPYPPSPKVMEAYEALETGKLGLYPDSESREFIDAVAQYYNVRPECVFAGNGSDECLALIFQTFFDKCSDAPVLFPDITYSFYKVWCKLYGIGYKNPPLDENFRIRKEDYTTGKNGGIILANPNAPTGICEGLEFIEDILKHNSGSIVVADEAYIDFGGESAIKLLDRYENLLVVHTFSKYRSLAGVRLSYTIGNAELIKYLNAVKNSFNSYPVNAVAQKLGAAALSDRDYYIQTAAKICATRARFTDELSRLGFVTTDSKANFIFTSHPEHAAGYIFNALKEHGIYVRYFNSPRIDNHLRITIGTDSQMDAVVKALQNIIM